MATFRTKTHRCTCMVPVPTTTFLHLHVFMLLLGVVISPAHLTEDTIANSTDHAPNSPVPTAMVTKPSSDKENVKSKTSLDEFRNLVDSLTRQVNSLKKSQARDRSHIRILEHRLHSTTDTLQTVQGEVIQMWQTVRDNRERASKLEDTHKSGHHIIRNIQSSSTKIKQDLDEIKSFRKICNRTISVLVKNLTRLDRKWRELEDTLAGMRIDSTELRTLQLKQRSGLKHVKVELAGFIESFISDEDDDETLEGDRRGVTLSENNQGARDLYQSKLADNSAGVLTDTKSAIEGSGADEKISLTKTINKKTNGKTHSESNNNSNSNKHGEKKMKKEIKIMKNSLEKKDIEIGKLYNMVLNLTLQMSQLENKVLTLQKDGEILGVQTAAANFSHYLMAIDQWRIMGPMVINATHDTQDQLDTYADLLLNNTNRMGKLEVKHLDLKYLMELTQQRIEENFHRMNESLKKMKHRMHNHQHKKDQSFEEDVALRLDDYGIQVDKLDARLLRVEVKVLNSSLNQCSKQQSDFYQDQQLHEFEKKAEKLQESVVVHRETLTRMDRGLYRLHLDMKRHNKTIDSLRKENTKIVGYLPQFYGMQQEVEKFLHHLPKDCDQIYRLGQKETGEYIIHPEGSSKSVRVFCHMTRKGGWTIVQRRFNGNEHFSRFWTDYKTGFGTVDKEFWLGNEYIHLLTKQANCSLHIEMEDILGNTWFAEYDVFRMNDESSKYSLFVGSYHGNATDSLGDANGMAFSTEDRDQDASSTHCALYYTSGWWYKHCHYCNLNGRYNVGIVWFNRKINEWLQLNKTIMKIKPRKR